MRAAEIQAAADAGHPLARWLRIAKARDVRGLDTLLADEVVFHSPVVHTPQRGKAVTTLYLLRIT